MAELVDAHGSGPCAARCGGSSPLSGTKYKSARASGPFFHSLILFSAFSDVRWWIRASHFIHPTALEGLFRARESEEGRHHSRNRKSKSCGERRDSAGQSWITGWRSHPEKIRNPSGIPTKEISGLFLKTAMCSALLWSTRYHPQFQK